MITSMRPWRACQKEYQKLNGRIYIYIYMYDSICIHIHYCVFILFSTPVQAAIPGIYNFFCAHFFLIILWSVIMFYNVCLFNRDAYLADCC